MRKPRSINPRTALLATTAAVAAALLVGNAMQRTATAALRSRIAADATVVSLPPLPADLPAPVRGYFAHAFPGGARAMRIVRLRNSGQLRTDPSSSRWLPFSATQLATPWPRAFVWDARIVHGGLGVVDRYAHGHGGGRVALLGALTMDEARAVPELDAGALHRYLAEAVWYPAALWPGHGLSWAPIDAHRALATLSDGAQRVSLEFRFGGDGAVESVYSPARWQRVDGGYRQARWEGRFSGDLQVQGIHVPARGEVGWYVGREWRPVWRGRVDAIEFDDAP
jgi:hypothetical protein